MRTSRIAFAIVCGASLVLALGCNKKPAGGAAGKSELVTKLDGLADRMCACKDGACADKVAADVADLASHTTDVAADDMAPAQAAQARVDACDAKLSKVVTDYLALTDEVCACKDKACGEKAAKGVTAWGNALKASGAKLRPSMVKAITDSGQAGVVCFQKLGVAVPR